MNTISKLIFALTLVLTMNTFVFAQMIKIEADGPVFNIPEVEAIIAKQEGKIQVLFTHTDMRTEKYKEVDLKTNDEIFMANGKKLTSVDELKEIYEKLAVGATLKIALKRDGDNKIISIVKADPKDLPKRKIKMQEVNTDDPKDAADEKDSGKVIIKRETKKND